MISLVIFDFDGTLFDTDESISKTIKLTFDVLLPDHVPPQSRIDQMIASGFGLTETFASLRPSAEDFTPAVEEEWIGHYRALYAVYGQALLKPFPGAKQLLAELTALKIPIAIVSNKGVAAVKTALERNGLDGYVPEDLIVGDNTPGAKRKPDPSSFTEVLVPILRERYGVQVEAKNVLVIGDTMADIQFARRIESRVCWCRYGYGDREACRAGGADFVVDSLSDVAGIVKAEI